MFIRIYRTSGIGDFGQAGITRFLRDHQCNSFCREMELENLDQEPTSEVDDEVVHIRHGKRRRSPSVGSDDGINQPQTRPSKKRASRRSSTGSGNTQQQVTRSRRVPPRSTRQNAQEHATEVDDLYEQSDDDNRVNDTVGDQDQVTEGDDEGTEGSTMQGTEGSTMHKSD